MQLLLRRVRKIPGNISCAHGVLGKHRAHKIYPQSSRNSSKACSGQAGNVTSGVAQIRSLFHGIRLFACDAETEQSATVTPSVAAAYRTVNLYWLGWTGLDCSASRKNTALLFVDTENKVHGNCQHICAAAVVIIRRGKVSVMLSARP